MSNITWEDYEKSDYGIIRGGLSGQSGDMPPELHMKKLEQTCMYEREDQLDDFFRSTLKDRTLDAPSLAQDLPRETQDMVRSEVLNIRHSGARTSAEPIHPDLFLGFTDRDPRGYHNAGPDFKKYAEQSSSRGKFKDFVSDHASDWTIPEGTRSEMRHIMDLRKTINPARERLKIFDTSFDSRGNNWSGLKTQKSGVTKTTMDGTILNLNDAKEPWQRRDNTTLRSNNINIGWKQTGDHRFSVAQYGLMNCAKRKANIQEAQYKTEESRKYETNPNEIQNRLMTNMMKEVDRRKNLDAYRKESQFMFDESASNKNQIGKLATDLSIVQQNTKQTIDIKEPNIIGDNIKRVRVYDPISHDTVVVDKEIFKKVTEAKNISFVKKTDPLFSRNVKAQEGKKKIAGDEIQVVVYSRAQPKHIMPLPVKTEHKWYDSEFEPIYKQNHQNYANMNSSYTEQQHDIDTKTNKSFNSFKKAVGYTQGIRDDIDEERNLDVIDDRENRVPVKMRGRAKLN